MSWRVDSRRKSYNLPDKRPRNAAENINWAAAHTGRGTRETNGTSTFCPEKSTLIVLLDIFLYERITSQAFIGELEGCIPNHLQESC